MRRRDLQAITGVLLLIFSLLSDHAVKAANADEPQAGAGAVRGQAALHPALVRSLNAPATPGRYGDCGPDALPETGLQGQVPRADQRSGRSSLGARCNLRLVGQADIGGRGANYQLAWYRDCAYVGMAGQVFQAPGGAKETDHPLSGVAVIDASNARRPKAVRILQSPVGQQEHEAIEVNERRGMLVMQIGGVMAQWIEIYDVSADCRKPVLKGRYDAGSPTFHGLRISPDGRTVYASDTTGVASLGRVLHVIDVSDMARPHLLMTWGPTDVAGSPPYAIHDLDVSPTGNRLYLATQPLGFAGVGFGVTARVPGTGPTLVVLDASDIQRRAPKPKLRFVSALDTFPNFGHTIQPARVAGLPYLFTSGELPYSGPRCPWGWGTVVDFQDERHPRPVSEIKLEVNELDHCIEANQDDANYSVHYSGVDDLKNTTKVFYTWYSSGLRVFDVRHPTAPQEIAYYKPPPRADTVFEPAAGGGSGWDAQNQFWDAATSVVRYRPGKRHVWFVSVANGFQILELARSRPDIRGASSSERADNSSASAASPRSGGSRNWLTRDTLACGFACVSPVSSKWNCSWGTAAR